MDNYNSFSLGVYDFDIYKDQLVVTDMINGKQTFVDKDHGIALMEWLSRVTA